MFVMQTQVHTQFDISKFNEYLSSHRDMSYQNLLNEYPAGLFRDSLNYNFLKSSYGSLLDSIYKLTTYEKELLNRNGFIVTDRYKYINFQQAYLDIYVKDMPVYISADAILHAFHYSFDGILFKMEESLSHTERDGFKFNDFFSLIKKRIKQLKDKSFSKSKLYLKVLKDLDIYFSVPERLYSNSNKVVPVFDENKSVLDSLISNIDSGKLLEVKLFAETPRLIDFSEYTTRGHYNKTEQMEQYFKMMVWFGKTDIYLTKPMHQDKKYIPTDEDIMRQTMMSALIAELIYQNDPNSDTSSTLKFYSIFDGIFDCLMGFRDNITIKDIYNLLVKNNLGNVSLLEDSLILKDLRESLLLLTSSKQLYNSQLLMSNPFVPKQVEPPSVFLLFGLGPTIDNFITASVVFDRIIYNGEKEKRILPSTLDILFALGNDAAIQLLENELNKFHYSSNLAALRYLINSYDNKFWDKSYYTLWLKAIRSLNPPLDRENMPEFMQTAAWQQKTMNTQLASWIELRHDFSLFAKQSKTFTIVCDFPDFFVEPVPELYKSLNKAMKRLDSLCNCIGFYFRSETDPKSSDFFNNWLTVTSNLACIAEKELIHENMNKSDSIFLKTMVNRVQYCPSYLSGWYANLFCDKLIELEYNKMDSEEIASLKNEKVTADFHTSPTDENGNEKGYVMHGGTGPINLSIITLKLPDGKLRSYAGPVLSYYETTTLGFKRLTNNEWDSLFNMGSFARPQFCNLYLADSNGSEIPGKISLLTYLQPNSVNYISYSSMISCFYYPNPFEENVNFLVKLPAVTDSYELILEVSEITGKRVYNVAYTGITSGNYQLKWDGCDEYGNKLQSGTYLYRISYGKLNSYGKILKH